MFVGIIDDRISFTFTSDPHLLDCDAVCVASWRTGLARLQGLQDKSDHLSFKRLLNYHANGFLTVDDIFVSPVYLKQSVLVVNAEHLFLNKIIIDQTEHSTRFKDNNNLNISPVST